MGGPQYGLCIYVYCGSSMALSRWVHPMDSATCCLPTGRAAPWAEDLSKEVGVRNKVCYFGQSHPRHLEGMLPSLSSLPRILSSPANSSH